MLQNALTLLLLAALPTIACAQIAVAPCYEPQIGQSLGGGDDWIYLGIPLGISFPYNGTTYSQIDISTNGFIFLGANNLIDPRCCAISGAQFTAGLPSIAILWTDLICNSANRANGVYYNTLPGRAVITWLGFNEYGSIGLQPDFTLQMQLTVNGEVTFFYSPTTHILASFHTAITGITQGLGASNPGSTDLSASFPNNTNGQPTIYEEWASGNFDLAQRTFELIPVGGGWLALDRPNCPFVLATAQPFGVGCPPLTGNPNAEFYELFSTGPAFDLSNRGIDLIPIGSGYLVVPSATAWFFGFANATALGDDQTSQVTLPFSFPTPAGTFSSFGVSSNGYLQFSNSLTATPYPGPLEFQNEEPRIYGLWTDLDPASCGQTYSDAISPTSWAFTWNGVAEYPSASPAATFQVQVRSDGTVSILWQSVQVISHPIMVGFSRGFGVADPFNQDLSATMPFQTGLGTQPLLLESRTMPILGTTLSLQVRQQPVNATAAALILGFQKITVPLSGLGMSGCVQQVSADAALFFASVGATTAMPLALPTTRNFLGFILHLQGAELAPLANAIGIATSNGLSLRLGTF